MLLVDMPMPGKCIDCPCHHFIRTWPHRGELMCSAMEWQYISREETNPVGMMDKWIVDAYGKRPDGCPIRGEADG